MLASSRNRPLLLVAAAPATALVSLTLLSLTAHGFELRPHYHFIRDSLVVEVVHYVLFIVSSSTSCRDGRAPSSHGGGVHSAG